MGTLNTTAAVDLQSAAEAKQLAIGLPFIRGVWFFVDPTSGSASNDGLTPDTAFANFLTAYTACTTGAGDGIALISRGATSAATTSYLTAALAWTKTCITVFGVASRTGYNSRARIANATASLALTYLVDIQGENNHFENVYFVNGGSDVAAVGCVKVTANRNSFVNCHFLGANHATPAAAATANDLTLSASECTFDRCYFGTNGIIRAATNGNLVLGITTTQIGQNFFTDCYFISYSATTTRGAILITNAATLGGFIVFDRCKFLNWNSGAQTAIATIIIGATPNNLGLLLDRCASVGYSAVGANNDTWFTTAAASAAGTGTMALSIV
jgi:hypothetical protein